jgi:hypothetical protein
MVWIVVDTNQAIRMKVLPEPSLGANIEGISLSPFVLGELLRSNNRRPLENLAKYPVRIGMSPGEVMDLIARRRRSQIVTCRPFLNLPTMQVREYLLSPSLQQDREREFVDTVKTHIDTTGKVLRSAAEKVRNAIRRRGGNPRDYKFDGMADARQRLANGRKNVLESLLLQFVSDGGSRDIRANPRALYTGAMANPYLRHYLHTFLWYTVSILQSWSSQFAKWNRVIENNEWTDMTLPLYAAPGDIVLTDDGTVRKAVSAVSPNGDIKAMCAAKL